MTDATYEPYNPGAAAAECGCGVGRCHCKPCGSCTGCGSSERCERCACGVSASGSDVAPADDPAPAAQSWPLLEDHDDAQDSSSYRPRTSTTSPSYASRYRSRSHSTWQSSTGTSRAPSRSRRGVAAGVCSAAACGVGGVAATNGSDEPTYQERYNQCITDFLAEHPRTGFGSSDPFDDLGSSSYLDNDFGGYDSYGSYDTYDFGSGYEGTVFTPEEHCDIWVN